MKYPTNRLLFLAFISLVVFSGFSFTTVDEEVEIVGVWVRKSDNLRIKVERENTDGLYSYIVEEGNKKFPCDVTPIPIYKNIRHIRNNLWSCHFLVVTLGSCATDYQEGIIRITEDGNMEITCPGFEKKIYSKLRPRYEI